MLLPLCGAGKWKWENFGPGSCLISLSYLAFPAREAFNLGGLRGVQIISFGLEKMSWAGSYITSPALCELIFSHTAISSVKPFGNAQWSVSCSSVSAWHSLSQLSPALSLCDNSCLRLVSLRQDQSRRRRQKGENNRGWFDEKVLSGDSLHNYFPYFHSQKESTVYPCTPSVCSSKRGNFCLAALKIFCVKKKKKKLCKLIFKRRDSNIDLIWNNKRLSPCSDIDVQALRCGTDICDICAVAAHIS